MFESLNIRRTVKEEIDTTEMDFVKLNEFIGRTVKVDGFFFTDGKFGKQVVIVAEGKLINMPQRAVEQFEKIEANEEMLHAALTDKLGIKIDKMIKTKNGDTVAYTLIDL